MATVAVHRDSKYGICFGNHASAADFDTVSSLAALATAGLPQEAVVEFKKNANVRRPYRASGQRMNVIADTANDVYHVSPSATLALPFYHTTTAGAAGIDILLGSIFQEVTEGASTPYVKTFTPPLSGAHPDFSADAGCFFTLVEETGVTAADKIMHSCAATKATLSCYPTQNDSRLYLSMDVIGRYLNEHVASTGYTGTMTFPSAYGYFPFNALRTVTVDVGNAGSPTAISTYGFTFTIETGLVPVPTAGYHGANAYNETNRVNRFYTVTGSVDLLWDATARTLITNETGGSSTEAEFVFNWGAANPITASGELCVSAYGRVNTSSFQGNEERIVRVEFDGSYYDAATDRFPLQVQYANAIDRGTTYSAGFWV